MGGNSNIFKIENLVNPWNKFKSLVLIYVYKYYFGLICSGKKLLPLLKFHNRKRPYTKLFSGIKLLFVSRFSKFCGTGIYTHFANAGVIGTLGYLVSLFITQCQKFHYTN